MIKYFNPELKDATWKELLTVPEIYSRKAQVWEDWYLNLTEFMLNYDANNLFKTEKFDKKYETMQFTTKEK